MPVELRPVKKERLSPGLRVHFPVFVTMALDPAVSDRAGADASGITVVCTDQHAVWWVFEAEGFRGQPNDVIERMAFYATRYRPQIISIEKVAFSYLYKDLLVPRLDGLGLNPQYVEYTESTRASKHTRISALQPLFRNGRIKLRTGLDRLVEELTNYQGPGSLAHEDVIDSLTQHIPIARAADPLEIAPVVYAEEVPPSKRGEREHQAGDRLDGTWTGGLT